MLFYQNQAAPGNEMCSSTSSISIEKMDATTVTSFIISIAVLQEAAGAAQAEETAPEAAAV